MAAHRMRADYSISLPLGLWNGHDGPAHGALMRYGLRLLDGLDLLFQHGSHGCVPTDRVRVVVFFRGYLF